MAAAVSNEPDSAPVVGEQSDGMLSLTKERELRMLRTRVATLTAQVAVFDKRLVPALTSRERWEGDHGYACGFHPQVEVSMETDEVTCKMCGAPLVAIDVLREYARGERRFAESINSLRDERSKLAKEVEHLKKQRSSLRSQIRKRGGTVS